jgi:hypothetical protein
MRHAVKGDCRKSMILNESNQRTESNLTSILTEEAFARCCPIKGIYQEICAL